MFILSSFSSSLEFWSVNHTSIYDNSESKVFKNINFLGEISNNWRNDLLWTNVADNCFEQYYDVLLQLQ